MSFRDRLPSAAVVVGEMSALTMLAPLEYQTGLYVGLPAGTAWTITGVVYPVTILAIVTGRLVVAAFGLVWLSGCVGVLHAASEQARRDYAMRVAQAAAAGSPPPGGDPGVDVLRVAISIAVITIVVLSMAAAWWLGTKWHESAAAAERAAEEELRVAERERRESRERQQEAQRRHDLEVLRVRQETADRDALRQRVAAREAAELAAAERAAEEELRAAEHARQVEVLRAQSGPQPSVPAPRNAPPRAPRNPPRNASRKTTTQPPQSASELQRRAEAPGKWRAAVAVGPEPSAADVAEWLYGPGDHDERQRNNARAHISKWRKEVAAEQSADDAGDAASGDA